MRILVKPSDLIKRFIWDKYEYFCLQGVNNEKIKELIEKDEEFELAEKDAFVIGFLCVIYTDQVIYKFKQFLLENLNNKNFEYEDGRLWTNRQILTEAVQTFKNKIPTDWVSDDLEFNYQLKQLEDIYESFNTGLEGLDCLIIQEWPCVKCGQVKKLINKIQ